MSLWSTAQQIYADCAEDPELAQYARTRGKALSRGIMDVEGQVTSSTVNSQTFTMKYGLTKEETHIVLGIVKNMLDAGGKISNRQIVDFG